VKIAIKHRPVFEPFKAFAVALVIFPFPFVNDPFGAAKKAFAVVNAVFEVALVHRSIVEDEAADTVLLVVDPESLVQVALLGNEDSSPLADFGVLAELPEVVVPFGVICTLFS
jgi:hypothetical protein